MLSRWLQSRSSLVVLVLVGLLATPARAEQYRVVDLTSAFTLQPKAINNLGQIAGDMAGPGNVRHACRLDPGDGIHPPVLVDLASRDPAIAGSESFGLGINDRGDVVGSAISPATNERHAYLFPASGGVVDLGALGHVTSVARGINSAGQIVGSVASSGSSFPALWNPGGATGQLLPTEGQGGAAQAINDQGVAVGSSGFFVPSRWVDGKLERLPGLRPGSPGGGTAWAINGSGQIVGEQGIDSGTGAGPHAFLFSGGSTVDLGSPVDLPEATIIPAGINALTAVVGNTSASVSWYWAPGFSRPVPLQNLILPGSGYTLTSVSGINDAGQIVGQATSSEGGRVVVLQPVNLAQPPVLTDPAVNPTTLPAVGGPVALSVTVADNTGVATVTATVIPQDDPVQQVKVTLNRVSGNAMQGLYQGTFNAPVNPTNRVVSYRAFFGAVDVDGNGADAESDLAFSVSADAQSPVVTEPGANPQSFPPAGGVSRLSVTVTDNTGVASVTAEITRPDNTKQSIMLLREGETARYSGEFTVPANTTESEQSYGVIFIARDAAGNETRTSVPLQLQVAPNVVPDTTAPELSGGEVSPTRLKSKGGTVTFSVSAADTVGVTEVQAVITKPDGSTTTVNLTRDSGSAASGTYRGTFEAPANNASAAKNYRVEFFALDAAGNRGSLSSALQFTVASPELVVSTTTLNFGSKPAGPGLRRYRLSFTLTAPGGIGLRRISVSVGTLQAPFSVTEGGGSFNLRLGTKRTVTVTFTPPAKRHTRFSGTLKITDHTNGRVLTVRVLGATL